MPYTVRDEEGHKIGEISSSYEEGAALGCTLGLLIPYLLLALAIMPAVALFQPQFFSLARHSARYNHLSSVGYAVISVGVIIGMARTISNRVTPSTRDSQTTTPQRPLHWPRLLAGLWWLVLAAAWFRAYLAWLAS